MIDPLAPGSVAAAMVGDPASLGFDELGAGATCLGVLVDRAHARLILLAVEAERSNAFAHEPWCANTRDWLQRRTVMTRAQAGAAARLARDLIPLDAITAALRDGAVTVEEARLLCRPMRNGRVRPLYPHYERAVLEQLLGLPRDLWETMIARVIDRLDEDGPAPDGEPDTSVGRCDRQLNGRYRIDADLDQVDGALFSSVLEGIVRQLRNDTSHEGAHAPTRSQLTGAALAEMARRAQASDRHNPDGNPVNVVVPHDTLDHADDPDHDHHDGCCEPATIDGAPLNGLQLRTLLCGATLRWLIVDSGGAITRLGTTTRHPSPTQRLYVSLRDGGCTFPGCAQPPHRCHLHHIRWVRHSGPTDDDNLILLCPRHHTLTHNGLWNPAFNVDDQSVTWIHRTGLTTTRHPPRARHPIPDLAGV